MIPLDRPPTTGPPVPQADPSFEPQLREMNEALMVSLVRQHELTEQAQRAERTLREEERVRRRQLELTNALRVSTVGELATGLAHELNQPLSSISNLVETCARYVQAGPIAPAKLLELLSDAANECMRAAGIVAHLRNLIDKGAAQIEPVNLSDIVDHVPQLLRREFELTRVAVRIDLPARPLRVDADRIQIEQVIVNLIQNAMDSIQEADGSQRLIELSARAVNGMGEVSVRDTGTGVSAPATERMFEAFFTTKTKGLGMGFALSRSILEAHRGRIWMEAPSDGGPGTVVRFSIPLKGPKRRRKDRIV
jgi:two-component system sensor kinase FixL